MKIITKEFERSFRCPHCGRMNSFTIQVEKIDELIDIHFICGKYHKICNKSEVYNNQIIINEIVKCEYCNIEVKYQDEI